MTDRREQLLRWYGSAYHALGRPLLAEVFKAREEQRNRWDAERAATEKG